MDPAAKLIFVFETAKPEKLLKIVLIFEFF